MWQPKRMSKTCGFCEQLTKSATIVTTQHPQKFLFREQPHESPTARNLTNLFKI